KVYFTTETPGGTLDLSEGSPTYTAPEDPGIYKLASQLNVITLVPFSEKVGGRIGMYYLGNWPFERGGRPKTAAYNNPSGFIEVTPENADTQVSAHFRLRDFLTKDQPNVWPKYLLLRPQLVDKLELTLAELEKMGHP